MNALNRTALILGATGQQGGATARALLNRGWKVRAYTRDPAQPAALALERSGAELIRGELDNLTSLTQAMNGVHGVFSVQPPSWQPDASTDAWEVHLGQLAADAAELAGVGHFIYTSVLGSQQAPLYGREGHKHLIENHVWKLGLPATVIRPSGFMENLLLPQFGIGSGSLFEATLPNVPVALIAVEDIGTIAARVFEAGSPFIGKSLDLVGDYRTPLQIADALSRTLQRRITHVHVPAETLRDYNETIARMYEWLNANGYPGTDREALRALHPGLLNLDAWLEQDGGQRLRQLVATGG